VNKHPNISPLNKTAQNISDDVDLFLAGTITRANLNVRIGHEVNEEFQRGYKQAGTDLRARLARIVDKWLGDAEEFFSA
jgi:hypothetical protein